MELLIKELDKLKEHEIKQTIDSRMKEFESIFQNQNESEIFNELCFCLLTANFSALGGIKIQKAIWNGFSTLSEEELAKELAKLGHRFPNVRASFIVQAREHKPKLKEIIKKEDKEARAWVAENVKGLGMKESSHFLRNIGLKNIAIIDFHIVDLLVAHNLIEKPKSRSLTKKQYLEIESILEKISQASRLSLAELDLYLWYMETGKVLK